MKYLKAKNYIDKSQENKINELNGNKVIEVEAVREVEEEKEKKRVGELPWSDMLDYYIKGEKIIEGGLKYTSSPTYEDVAKKFNCSFQTVAQEGAKENWVKKREIYRGKVDGKFSFYGTLAAEINGEILANVKNLVRKVEKTINDPTFLPDPKKLITDGEGSIYVIDEDDVARLIDPREYGKNNKSQILLNMMKSLEVANKICNSTVQIEVDNIELGIEMEEDKGNRNKEARSQSRQKKIKELTSRLNEQKMNEKMEMMRNKKQENKEAGIKKEKIDKIKIT